MHLSPYAHFMNANKKKKKRKIGGNGKKNDTKNIIIRIRITVIIITITIPQSSTATNAPLRNNIHVSKVHCRSAVRFGRMLPGYPITAHHLYMVLM